MNDPRPPVDDPATRELLRRARGGERSALEQLLLRNLDWLRDRIRRRLAPQLRRELDSEDMLQDLVLDLLARPAIRNAKDEEHLRALLARAVDGDLIDRLRFSGRARRDRGREQRLNSGSGFGDARPVDSVTRPSQNLLRDERIAWIRIAMEKLDADERRILTWRVWEQRSFQAIGELLGVAEDAARMRCNRALARLAREVERLRA
jgi:RNA polymerase sigma factor (sigma-70 family)